MILKLIAVGLTVGSLLFCGQADAQTTGQRTVVKLGVSGRPDQAALELALRRGYFSEYGLDVQTVQANIGMDFIASVGTNQLQVASGSPNAGLFNAMNRGVDLRLVADFAHVGDGVNDGTVSIVVRADLFDSGAVKSIRDLKGRSLNLGPGRAQYPDVLMDKLFKQNGMTMEDVRRTHLTFADSLSAMGTKNIDAAFMVEPLVTMGDKQNITRVLVRTGAVDPGAVLSVIFFSSEFAKQTDAATKFVAAFLRGVRDYQDAFFHKKNQDETIAVLTAHLPVKDPEVWKAASPQHTDPNGIFNVADLKRQAAVYQANGDITGPIPDIDKHIDTKFAEGAIKLIGRR